MPNLVGCSSVIDASTVDVGIALNSPVCGGVALLLEVWQLMQPDAIVASRSGAAAV